MKKIGGLGKDLTKGVAKGAAQSILTGLVVEIIEESGAKKIAKEKILEAGKTILKDDSIPAADKVKKEVMKKRWRRQRERAMKTPLSVAD